MSNNPPLPRDVQDFQFKLVTRLKVYDRREDISSGHVNLLAVSSKLGLVFVAAPTHLQIFRTSVLLESHGGKGVGSDIDTFPRYCVKLPSPPSHIGISCDHAHVAVVLAPKDANQYPVAQIYVISSLISKNTAPAWEIQLSTIPGVAVRDIAWNPRLPNLICVCLCDGSVSVYELKGQSQAVESNSLPAATGAKCICWSPKGKQLVVGTIHGPFIQYKPDLKQVKVISPPQPAGCAPISLLWLSSFQFAVVYGSPLDNENGSSRPGLFIVNAPKGESESHLNYDDICYSAGESRPPQYYLSHIPKWNILLMSSANSMEVGVLASDGSGAEPLVWEQWTLEDASRAELPLSPSREEMTAVGMSVDTSPTAHLPWGENQSIPPAPLLLILSNHGLLCTFNIINLRPGAAQDLCSPPEVIPGIQEVLVNVGPPSMPSLVPPTSLAPFDATPQNKAVTFSATSNAFHQGTLPSFSAATATVPNFTPVSSSPAPSTLFGGPAGKTDVGKGWLTGSSGSSSFGFGALGSSLAPSKDVSLPSSAPAQTFLFSASSAGAFPATAAAMAPTPQATFSPPQPDQQPAQQVPSIKVPQPPQTTAPLPTHHALSAQQQPSKPLPFQVAPTPVVIGPSKATMERSKSGIGQSGDVVQGTVQPVIAAPLPSPSVPSVPDSTIFKAIAQETALFEKELMQLKMRHQKFNIMIGTPDEKKTLRVKVDAMESFLGELSEATLGHTRMEIYSLRTLLMEAFAWVEEARSRHLYSKNPRYLHLAMVQELDPVIKKHIVAIRNRVHYLDMQLQQLDASLDNQWGTFQDSCNKKKRKQQTWGLMDSTQFGKREIHMPSLEFVYQTILSQQQILEKHLARLDELELKVRNRVNWELNGNSFASLAGFQHDKRGPSTNHERTGSVEQDLSSMAESLLTLQLGESRLKGKISEQSGKRNPLVPKKMPSRQVSQLCSLLAHKPMTRVIPSPRGISSLNVLPMPSKGADSRALTLQDDPVGTRIDSDVAPSSGKTPKATSTPVKKEVAQSKVTMVASDLPNALTSVSAPKVSSASSVSFGAESQSHPLSVFSVPKSEESGSALLDSASKQSKNLAPLSGPVKSSSSIVAGVGVSPLSVTSAVTNVKNSSIPAKNIFGKGFPAATTSIPVSSPPSSLPSGTTISVSPQVAAQPSSFFSGGGPSLASTTPSEGSSWAFSTSGSFSIGSSSKPGGISSGKPVVPPLATSVPTPTTTAAPTSSPAPAFSLNFSSNSKPSFSIAPKPATQPSFTLPLPLFGGKGGSTSLSSPSSKEEPLFVFGGSALGPGVSKPSSKLVMEESVASSKKETIELEKDNKQKLEDTKSDKSSSVDVEPAQSNEEKMKQVMPEKLPTTFSFGSAFGQTLVPPGKIPVAVSLPVTSAPASAPSPASAQSPTYEDVTPEDKVEKNIVKEKPEGKPPVTRSLFTNFSFKLSEGESDTFGTKPLVFGVPSSPSPPTSVPVSTPIVETPASVATAPHLSVSVAPSETVSKSLPIIPQPETTSATSTTNPLSSLGTIVANLGSSTGSTFGKVTSEVPKPVESSSFSSFSFALPSKDEGAKPLPSEPVVELSPTDGQKTTPIKGLSPVSPPGTTLPSSPPVSGAASASAAPDFGQGLANILGQAMPTTPAQAMPTTAQVQPAQNPFAVGGSSSVFGSSSGNSPSTANLFGKPAEGAPAINLFGQPIKQDAATPSFFGSSPSATPPATTVPTFGSSSVFGQPASTSSSVFGASGFGSKPVFGQSMSSGSTGFSLGGSVFGQSAGSPSVFGSPSATATSGGNLFQSPVATSSASTFGASGGSVFGSVAQAGFGSPTSSFQAKPGGFGGSPVFGAMASGGSSPSFGGAATFGSPPAFGSHVFGAAASTAGSGSIFGSGGAASTSTFENLASAPTLTFGNLAQGGGPSSPFGASQPQSPPAFGSGGSSSGTGGSSSFGGSSFTSWR